MSRQVGVAAAAFALGGIVLVVAPMVLLHMEIESLTNEYAECDPPDDVRLNVVPAVRTLEAGYSEAQLRNAAAIVTEGHERGLSDQAIVIALAVANQESGFVNYANDGRGGDLDITQNGIARSLALPHDAVATDHGSLGIFQQQWPWLGTMSELMDPTVAAGKFYAALVRVPGWERMPLTVAGQRVQRSAFPNAYADDEALARRLLPGLASAGYAASSEATGTPCPPPPGECPATGSSAERGLTEDALRVVRCVQQTFGFQDVLGAGERADNPTSDHAGGRAVDIMIRDWATASGRSQGDQIAAWMQDHAQSLGVRYVIWRARIWSVARAREGWRSYSHPAGTGGATAQHFDHVHVSVHGDTGTGFGGGGAVLFPLPRGSGYRDQQNWGRRTSLWSQVHTGTDLSVACGTPVLAATTGTVVVQTDQSWSGRWLVQVSTGDAQLATWYAHMQSLSVRDGQAVGAGTRIGSVGSEGNSTGCHLHFEVHPGGGSIYEDDVDPTHWLRENVGTGSPASPTVVPASSQVDLGSLDFVLSSFNVLGNSHTTATGNRPWMESGTVRIRRAIQLLDRHRVDVVGLQEFQRPQSREFTRVAGNRYAVFPDADSGHRDTDNAIAWRKARWEFNGFETVKIPYFNGRIREMPVVLLRDRATGDQAFFGNFHNPASVRRFGSQQRWRDIATRRELDLVRRLTEAYRLPVFVTGDMNERDEFFCRFTAGGGMIAANGGHNDGVCRPPPRTGIDWILGTPGVEFSDYTADRSSLVKATSDHPMVVARVRTDQ